MIPAAQVDPEQVDAVQEMASLCGVLNASYARLVTIVAAALADESWAIAGIRSPEHWLTMRTGLSPFRARTVVSIAQRCGELPTVMGEFAGGQLSVDQVAVIARYAPAHVEASVAELAVHASVPQLRRSLSRYSFDPPAENGYTQQDTTFPTKTTKTTETATNDTETADTAPHDPEVANGGLADGAVKAGDPPSWNGFALEPDRASAPAELSVSYDQWGQLTLRFSAAADLGAIVEAALKEAKDALFRAGHPKPTAADAMVEVARRSLGAAESINRRDSFRTYVHLDSEGAWLTGRPRLPAHLAAKLTCDGIVQPVWHTQGAPVNVGRAQRIVPTRTRRLVEDRDRGCRFPACHATAHLECHHLIHWADGGPTDTTNLCSLCDFHHDGHHDGDFTITGDADDPTGLTFTTRGGFPIHPGPTFTTPTRPPAPGSPPPTATPPATTQATPTPPAPPYRGPTGETLNLRWLTFHEPPVHEPRVPASV